MFLEEGKSLILIEKSELRFPQKMQTLLLISSLVLIDFVDTIYCILLQNTLSNMILVPIKVRRHGETKHLEEKSKYYHGL